jgi:hypothetical protein
MESPTSCLNPVRGLFAAVVGASVGAVAPIVVLFGLAALRWWVRGAPEFDRRYDFAWIRDALPGPVVGCATVFACAGWATYAPRGGFRLVRTLAIVTAISLAIWCLPGWVSLWAEITPRRLKGIEHPVFYASEWIVLVGPPIVAAALVTAVRARGARERSSEAGAAPKAAASSHRSA